MVRSDKKLNTRQPSSRPSSGWPCAPVHVRLKLGSSARAATRRHDMWCSNLRSHPYMVFHVVGLRLGPRAGGGNREPGANPGLPRSGK